MTSIPEALSGKFQGSFAYKTIKDRLPVILTKVIDVTCRQRHDIKSKYGDEGIEDLKLVTNHLSELRYRMTTNKPLLPVTDSGSDVDLWNQRLKQYETEHPDDFSWFKCPWLLAECYLYRKISEAFQCSHRLKNFDPFKFQKEEAFIGSLPVIEKLTDFLNQWRRMEEQENGESSDEVKNREMFTTFFQISLWGNKFDLSISVGEHRNHVKSPLDQVDELHPYILCDDSDKVYRFIDRNFAKKRLDLVLDNAGLELFGDLCLAEYFLSRKSVETVVFHVKCIPWFVSDVTGRDFNWQLEMLRGSHVTSLAELGRRWCGRLDDGSFVVKEHPFWTLANPFCDMADVSRDLYDELSSQSDLIVFKGDLNYRKLVGDLNWPHETPFSAALRGFEPAPLVTLRTLKADVVVGVTDEKVQRATASHDDWMISGDYAVVQYHARG